MATMSSDELANVAGGKGGNKGGNKTGGDDGGGLGGPDVYTDDSGRC